MACKTSYEMHHNFPKIADEAGFTFNTHRPRIRIDWNKIRLIDLENLIRERKFVLIEQHVNDVLDCVLESEFDVRILDEGVMKMFRLAQLAVEYQQFCRHYLDRSVHVLREEITSLAQELDDSKKELREREEEIRKLKRKSKHTYRHTPLPYGNDNIASMILKTLSQKNEIFSCSTGDALQYNKCTYCDKVFMNQLYLKSHMSRRHPNALEIPQRDSEEFTQTKMSSPENTKLRDEILDLKLKLKEMETTIKNTTEQVNSNAANQNKAENNTDQAKPDTRHMKDAEVATNNEDYLLDRIEEWKKEEQEKYHKEINLLRTQIMDSIKTFKEKEAIPSSPNPEHTIIDQLNTTISKQGAEIINLQQELKDSRLKIENEDAERRKENEAQMKLWANRAETHAKQYESLLQKLNEVAREAQESRAQAEAEKYKVAQLETMLQQSLNSNENERVKMDTKATPKKLKSTQIASENNGQESPTKKKPIGKTAPAADHQTLEKLHQKAQALLNMGSLSSSSTDSSEENIRLGKSKPTMKHTKSAKVSNHKKAKVSKIVKEANHIQPYIHVNHESHSSNNKADKKINNESPVVIEKSDKKIKSLKPKLNSNNTTAMKIERNGPILTPGSPMKILRAKITEEVNNRLISAGVDPLKITLPKFDYQKQKMQLQQQLEVKAKKNPSHEKVRHTILAYLDSSVPRKAEIPQKDYISPNKTSKAFSLTSVISNVKSKALSLVKSSDTSAKAKRKSLDAEVAKRVISMLNTPPDSSHSSPVNKYNYVTTQPQLESRRTHTITKNLKNQEPANIRDKNNGKRMNSMRRIPNLNTNTDSEDDSNESDHKYYKATVQQSTKSIENLIKSPARRPQSANSDYNQTVKKYTITDNNLLRSQSVTNVSIPNTEINVENKHSHKDENSESSENTAGEEPIIKDVSQNAKQTKGVLKNASSTSSLNKKKVLFDMDAIQMKSLSASPSQSLTEKSDGNENYELGLINLDGEEWDISSIENEPLKTDTKLQINTRTSPKIAELKQTIESQLARRNGTPSTAIVGGIDVLAPTPGLRASSVAGSNTSLGSSILDDSESLPPVVNNKAFVKPKTTTHKDDSEFDLSEFSIDGITSNHKNENDAF